MAEKLPYNLNVTKVANRIYFFYIGLTLLITLRMVLGVAVTKLGQDQPFILRAYPKMIDRFQTTWAQAKNSSAL